MLSPALGGGLFFGSFVVARILHEKALRTLSTEEKGRLVEEFSKYRMVALVPMAAMAALYFAMAQFGLSMAVFFSVYIPAFILFAAVSHVYVFRKLRETEVAPDFVRNFALSRVVQLAGFAALLLTL